MLNGPLDRNSILDHIRTELLQIVPDKRLNHVVIDENTRLADLAISSLNLAELVSSLESLFEVDPFAELVPITSIHDMRDLCTAYLTCLAPRVDRQDLLDEELRSIRARAHEHRKP